MRASTLGSLAALLAALFVTPRTHAQSTPPPIAPELRARFGFLGPEIVKIGDGIRGLRCADLSGDGQVQVVVEDPRRARLEIRTWNGEELEGQNESTVGSITGLAVADFDRDGRADTAMLDSRGRLRVRLRADDAPDLEPVDVGPAAGGDALRAADLDGDGAADIVAWTRDGLRTVTRIASGAVVSAAMPLDEGAVRALHLHDADGDGAVDLVVALGVDRMPLRIKRGGGDGTFGPWLILDVPALRDVFPGTGVGGTPTLASIEGPHRRVVEYALREDPQGTALELTALPKTRARGALPFAMGDLDGDGDTDLVIALPDRATLFVLLEDDGCFTTLTVPTFAGIGGLAIGDLDGDGLDDLLIASPEEGALGWKNGAEPLAAFPVRLPVKEMPVAVTVHDGKAFAICRTERREATLQRVQVGAATSTVLCELGRLGGDPQRLVALELDGRDGAELAFVVPGDGLRVVTDLDSDEARALEADAGFTKRMDDGALAWTSGERPELLVARERYARRFRFDADGQPTILGQDNGPEGIEAMSLVAVRPDGGLLLYDAKGDRLHRVSADGAATSVDVPPLGFTHVLAHGSDAVLIGAKGVLRVPLGRGFALDALRTHEPPTDDTSYYGGLAVDLDGDGARELAMLDSDMHGIQVLVARDGALDRGLAFPIFEIQEAGSDVTEPRELAAGDLDGDGLLDLVAICFDRLLVYRQEK